MGQGRGPEGPALVRAVQDPLMQAVGAPQGEHDASLSTVHPGLQALRERDRGAPLSDDERYKAIGRVDAREETLSLLL